MYMNVKELNEQQLEQLKMDLFYNTDQHDDLSNKDLRIIDNCTTWHEIPNKLIYKIFDGISFVEEDFGLVEETKPIQSYSYSLWNDILEIFVVDMDGNEFMLATLCDCEDLEDFELNNLALVTIEEMGYEIKGDQ